MWPHTKNTVKENERDKRSVIRHKHEGLRHGNEDVPVCKLRIRGNSLRVLEISHRAHL